jgi:hypothetical protein
MPTLINIIQSSPIPLLVNIIHVSAIFVNFRKEIFVNIFEYRWNFSRKCKNFRENVKRKFSFHPEW